jgi:dTMP kinase
VLTREPGGTGTGERIRALLLDPELPAVAARTETLLLLADRAQHMAEVVGPALDAGRDVVCDRFSGSTLAYQGYGRGLDLAELARLSAWSTNGVEPDRVILLQVSRSLALARRRAERRPDRMELEGAGFFDRVQAGYAELAAADPVRWRVVDGAGTIDEVATLVAAAAGG